MAQQLLESRRRLPALLPAQVAALGAPGPPLLGGASLYLALRLPRPQYGRHTRAAVQVACAANRSDLSIAEESCRGPGHVRVRESKCGSPNRALPRPCEKQCAQRRRRWVSGQRGAQRAPLDSEAVLHEVAAGALTARVSQGGQGGREAARGSGGRKRRQGKRGRLRRSTEQASPSTALAYHEPENNRRTSTTAGARPTKQGELTLNPQHQAKRGRPPHPS